jgi:hypothetical protein
MEAAGSSETLVSVYQITRSHISEDSNRRVVNEKLSSSDVASVLYSEDSRLNLGRSTEYDDRLPVPSAHVAIS